MRWPAASAIAIAVRISCALSLMDSRVKLPAPPWIAMPHRGRSSVVGDGVPVEHAEAAAIAIRSKKHL
jgi:hypothetical protein